MREIFNIPTTASLSVNEQQLHAGLYWTMALSRQATCVIQRMWPSEVKSLDGVRALGTVYLERYTDGESSLIADLFGSVVLIRLFAGNVIVSASAADRDVAHNSVERLRLLFPETRMATEDTIRVTFHSMRRTMSRRLAVPPWEEVKRNYAATTRTQLQSLMTTRDFQGGRLILWHGLPGTGKTHALRALGWEWREWCSLNYILDPEAFFGNTDYLVETLMQARVDEEWDEEKPNGWRLFVAEDTGELLAKDAKAQTGQGLSRLLNVTDGFLGQGLRTIILITTNEELSDMNEAVVRPGRCASLVEFVPFSTGAANAWLAAHGKPPLSGKKARTLAELYAGVDSRQEALGFAPSDIAVH